MKKIIILLIQIIFIGGISAQTFNPNLVEDTSKKVRENWIGADNFYEGDTLKSEPFLTIKSDTKPIHNLLSEDIKVYPNPTSGIIKIEGIPKEWPAEILLFNIVGKQIKKSPVTHPVTKIDFSSEPDGVYFLKINNYTKKIIKRLI